MKKLHRKINYNSVLLQKPTSQCTYLLSVYTQNRLFCEAWHRVQYILQQRGFAGFFSCPLYNKQASHAEQIKTCYQEQNQLLVFSRRDMIWLYEELNGSLTRWAGAKPGGSSQ